MNRKAKRLNQQWQCCFYHEHFHFNIPGLLLVIRIMYVRIAGVVFFCAATQSRSFFFFFLLCRSIMNFLSFFFFF